MNGIYRKSRISLNIKNTYTAMLFIFPAFVVTAIICFYPLINGVLLSFKDYFFGKGTWNWVGFENYLKIFSNNEVFSSFGFTIFYCSAATFLLFIIGMFIALLLNRKMTGMNIIKGLLILPWAIPVFVNGFLWTWLFHVQFGLINFFLLKLHFIEENLNWVGSYTLAKIAVLIPYLWRAVPFNMLNYLAAFQTIDEDLYEAADIDGANNIQKFFFITLPSIKNIIIIIAILNFVWTFQEFTTIWIITKGGPGTATDVAAIDIYRAAFSARDFGKASAIGVVWVIFIILLVAIILKTFLKQDNSIKKGL